MSVGRRKSKNPQKCQWESEESIQEANDEVQQIINPDFSSNIINAESKSRINPQLIDHDKSRSHFLTQPAKLDTLSPSAAHVMEQIDKFAANNSSRNADKKQRVSPHNEMSIDEVMQSTKQISFGECTLCKITFNDWFSSVEHIHCHRSTFVPPCIAGNYFPLKKQHSCIACQKRYRNQNELVLHARTEHDLTKAPYECVLCGKVLPTLAMLQDHIDLKEIVMRCPVCSSIHGHEYKLYSHLSQCLQTFHPHLKHLRCHICDHRINVDDVANHLIQHSFHSHEFRIKKPKKAAVVAKEPSSPAVFLCEVCNGSFGSFEEFKDHLSRHGDSKKFCPLCYLKGFIRADFIVRHLLLRCPMRNAEQYKFGATITSLGKYYNRNFLEILKDMQPSVPLQEGLQSWSNVPLVEEFLKSFESFTKEELRRIPELSASFQQDPGSSTDIDLLSWLTDFERRLSNKNASYSKGGRYPTLPKSFNESEFNAINENVRQGFKEYQNTGKPIEIHLESGDGQVVLSSQKATDLESLSYPKMTHRRTVKHYEKKCSNVRLLPPFDLERLKKLNDEALKLMELSPVEDHIKSKDFTAEHFLRLEWEAQFLRKSKPFYVRENPEIKRFSPLYKRTVDQKDPSFDLNVVQSMKTEAERQQYCKEQFERLNVVESDIQRLLSEAQELSSP